MAGGNLFFVWATIYLTIQGSRRQSIQGVPQQRSCRWQRVAKSTCLTVVGYALNLCDDRKRVTPWWRAAACQNKIEWLKAREGLTITTTNTRLILIWARWLNLDYADGDLVLDVSKCWLTILYLWLPNLLVRPWLLYLIERIKLSVDDVVYLDMLTTGFSIPRCQHGKFRKSDVWIWPSKAQHSFIWDFQAHDYSFMKRNKLAKLLPCRML